MKNVMTIVSVLALLLVVLAAIAVAAIMPDTNNLAIMLLGAEVMITGLWVSNALREIARAINGLHPSARELQRLVDGHRPGEQRD